MPIYEYACERCGAKFEILHRSVKHEDPSCPNCGAKEVKRLLSVFGFSCGGEFVSSSSPGGSCATCSSKNCSSCK